MHLVNVAVLYMLPSLTLVGIVLKGSQDFQEHSSTALGRPSSALPDCLRGTEYGSGAQRKSCPATASSERFAHVRRSDPRIPIPKPTKHKPLKSTFRKAVGSRAGRPLPPGENLIGRVRKDGAISPLKLPFLSTDLY